MKATDRNKSCLICGKTYYNPYGLSMKQWKTRKYCSYLCSRKANGERMKGLDETKHSHWKGDNVGYFGVHDWMTKHFGQPKECEVCGLKDTKRAYHWANLTNYLRDRKDWKRMCVSCHRKYDYSRQNQQLESA